MMKEIFPGVFSSTNGKEIFTYSKDYVKWLPQHSKLAAAIMNGIKEMPVKPGSIILYLGAASGTTVSHVSNIIGSSGTVYAIEFSEKPFYSLLDLAGKQKNIAPIFADARKTKDYFWVEECDCIYVDMADPQEIEIAIRLSDIFLKKDGYLVIAVKSQSIDVVKSPSQVYKEAIEKLEKANFRLLENIDLEPYEEKHSMIVLVR